MIILSLVSIGLWCVIWIHDEYSTFKSESESLRLEYLESQKEVLKSEVKSVVRYIRYMMNQADQEMQRTLKERVYEAHAIALNIFQQNKTSKTLPEIGNMIKDALRPIRFNAGRGYYFAVSMDGVEQLYPIKPEFEGQNLIDLKDLKGNYVIRDEIEIIKKSGEGFVTDYWSKPNKDAALLFPKISFVKHFAPLDWYFGTGEYLVDAEMQNQHEILNRIAGLRFGLDSYFFGSTFSGGSLFSNSKITVGGNNIWGLTDPNGVKIIQEQRRVAEDPEGGFVHYSWHKSDVLSPSPKISYVLGVPEWEWTIGAGVYLDTIENAISKKREAMENGLRTKIIKSIFILMLLLVLIYFWSKRISNQMAKTIEIFSLSLKKANTDEIMINSSDLHLQEFKMIAELTNEMVIDRLQVEKALRESEEKFRGFAEHSLVGIYLIQAGILRYVNPKFAEIFGYTVEECLDNMSFHNLVHPDDRPTVEEQVQRRISGEIKSVQYTFNGLKNDGRIITVEVFGSSIIVDGQSAVTGTLLDITHRKRMEADRERLLTAIEQSAETIMITNNEGDMQYVNPAFERNTGYLREEVMGENPRILKSDEQDEFFYQKMWQTITAGGVWHGRLVNRRKDLSLYTEEATISPVLNSEGAIINFVAVKRDITDMIAMEEKLRQSQKMETIGTFAGGIAHDFNNILFPIVGHTEMLLDDITEQSPLYDSLVEIMNGAMRARNLVKQIVTFSRQNRNEVKLVKIQSVIKEALKLIRSTIPATISIKQDFQTHPMIIKADPIQIHQVVMNLATNAYHAMEDTGGILEVGLEQIELDQQDRLKSGLKTGIYACLTIGDTGIGIDSQSKGRIFDPFFTTKEPGKGTGMGLSVVHGIVKKIGGDIQVNSEPGKGTEFHVYLPMEMSHALPKNSKISDPIQGGTERILLVDDEKAIAIMEKRMLERLGYQVVSHTSSLDALETFRADPSKFDIVITDNSMPNLSGDQLASELITIRADIPVLLCTGFSGKISDDKIEAMGIRGFLMKPVVRKELVRKLREVLDNKESAPR
ncbi:cache domain-containing protein [Desulfobacterales bacterium HSG17]|nr:cache domain-containing protein [Desulfobacterales bacterium HSG17]